MSITNSHQTREAVRRRYADIARAGSFCCGIEDDVASAHIEARKAAVSA